MKRRRWVGTVPTLVMVCGLGGAWVAIPGLHGGGLKNGRPPRIVDARFLNEETKAGMALYAPTWLPHDGRPGVVGTRKGVHRILCDYADPASSAICIVAQEPRTPERDRYHHEHLETKADAQGRIAAGKTGYFITGESGERRLLWYEPDMTLVLSSNIMTDPEMLRVAAGMRNR